MKILRYLLGACLVTLITTHEAYSMQTRAQGTKLNVVEGVLRNKIAQNLATLDAQQYWQWSQDVYNNFNQLPVNLQNTYRKQIRDKKLSLSTQTIRNLLSYWAGEINQRSLTASGQVYPQLLTMLQDASDFIGYAQVTRTPEYINFIASIAALNSALQGTSSYAAFQNAIGEQNLRTIVALAGEMQPIAPSTLPSQQSMNPLEKLALVEGQLNGLINLFGQQFPDEAEAYNAMKDLLSTLVQQIRYAYVMVRSEATINNIKTRIQQAVTAETTEVMNDYRAGLRNDALGSFILASIAVALVNSVDPEFAEVLNQIFATGVPENVQGELANMLNLSSMTGSNVPAGSSQPGSITDYLRNLANDAYQSSQTGSLTGSITPAPTQSSLDALIAQPNEGVAEYLARINNVINNLPNLDGRALESTGKNYASISWRQTFKSLIEGGYSNELYAAGSTATGRQALILAEANSALTNITSNNNATGEEKFLLVCYWTIQNQIWKLWDAQWANGNLQPIINVMRNSLGL